MHIRMWPYCAVLITCVYRNPLCTLLPQTRDLSSLKEMFLYTEIPLWPFYTANILRRRSVNIFIRDTYCVHCTVQCTVCKMYSMYSMVQYVLYNAMLWSWSQWSQDEFEEPEPYNWEFFLWFTIWNVSEQKKIFKFKFLIYK